MSSPDTDIDSIPLEILNLVSFATNCGQPLIDLEDPIVPARVASGVVNPLFSNADLESFTLGLFTEVCDLPSFTESAAQCKTLCSLKFLTFCGLGPRTLPATIQTVAAALSTPHLERLTLFGPKLDPESARRLSLTPGFVALTRLKLRRVGVSREVIVELRKIRTLRGIVLEANDMGDSGAIAFAAALPFWPELAEIKLKRESVGPMGAKALGAAWASAAGRLGRLRIVNLCHNELGDEGIIAIANGLMARRPLRSLAKLDLNHTGFSILGAQKLSELIKRSPALESVNISHNDIGDSAVSLGTALSKSKATLVTLNLGVCGFGVDTLSSVIVGLSGATRLSQLYLHKNYLGNAMAKSLAESVISRCVNLRRLRLLGGVGTEGVKAIAAALATCEIQALDLCENNFGPEGAVRLLTTLTRAHSPLISLRLHACGIEDAGAEALGVLIQGARWIREVWVGDNGIGPSGIKKIAEAVWHSGVVTLGLRGNILGEEGAQYVAECIIQGNIGVKLLDLRETSLGDEGAKVLASALWKAGGEKRSLYVSDHGDFGDVGREQLKKTLEGLLGRHMRVCFFTY